jgi:hypothetical protein
MLNLLFTSDYEIHGNGDGSPLGLMVETTKRQMEVMNKYGAKLTIFADIAEIMKFKEYRDKYKKDDYNYEAIIDQLKEAVKTGHDVQLHIHSSYFNAKFENDRWKQDWTEYNLANLPYDKIEKYITLGKNFLEDLLKPVDKNYQCMAFRAAGWSMMPTKNIYTALVKNGIKIDSSLWQHGKRSGALDFDYTNTYSEALPWFIDENDVCKKDNNSKLLEIPIFCENKNIISFITPVRLYRVVSASFHKHKVIEETDAASNISFKQEKQSKLQKLKKMITQKQPWKLDLNQATSRQMINTLKEIESKYSDYNHPIPVIFSGHSKIFIKYNERTLEPLLKYAAKHKDKYSFFTYRDIDTEQYRD